ncbi:MAG: hypothetical protein Q9183_005976, partial [Haloplaca sp. 2 TL-2023]
RAAMILDLRNKATILDLRNKATILDLRNPAKNLDLKNLTISEHRTKCQSRGVAILSAAADVDVETRAAPTVLSSDDHRHEEPGEINLTKTQKQLLR